MEQPKSSLPRRRKKKGNHTSVFVGAFAIAAAVLVGLDVFEAIAKTKLEIGGGDRMTQAGIAFSAASVFATLYALVASIWHAFKNGRD